MRAIVGDAQDFFRSGMSTMLRRALDFTSVHQVTTQAELVGQLSSGGRTALAIVDLDLPGLDGTDALHLLRERYPGTRIAVTSNVAARDTILQALRAGVHGFIPKSYLVPQVIEAIAMIMNGRIFVPPSLADFGKAAESSEPAPGVGDTPQDNAMAALTARQREVLAVLSTGLSNKEIARTLNIAPGTVKVHVNAAYRALGVHNRLSAASLLRSQPRGDDPD